MNAATSMAPDNPYMVQSADWTPLAPESPRQSLPTDNPFSGKYWQWQGRRSAEKASCFSCICERKASCRRRVDGAPVRGLSRPRTSAEGSPIHAAVCCSLTAPLSRTLCMARQGTSTNLCHDPVARPLWHDHPTLQWVGWYIALCFSRPCTH